MQITSNRQKGLFMEALFPLHKFVFNVVMLSKVSQGPTQLFSAMGKPISMQDCQ